MSRAPRWHGTPSGEIVVFASVSVRSRVTVWHLATSRIDQLPEVHMGSHELLAIIVRTGSGEPSREALIERRGSAEVEELADIVGVEAVIEALDALRQLSF